MVLALAGDSTTTSFCAIACSIVDCCVLGLVSSPPNLDLIGKNCPLGDFFSRRAPPRDCSARVAAGVKCRASLQASHPTQHFGAARHSHIPLALVDPVGGSLPGIRLGDHATFSLNCQTGDAFFTRLSPDALRGAAERLAQTHSAPSATLA